MALQLAGRDDDELSSMARAVAGLALAVRPHNGLPRAVVAVGRAGGNALSPVRDYPAGRGGNGGLRHSPPHRHLPLHGIVLDKDGQALQGCNKPDSHSAGGGFNCRGRVAGPVVSTGRNDG